MTPAKNRKPLTREEHIREESKRAAEFGMTPKSAISMEKNFRVARSTPTQFSAGSTLVPTRSVAEFNDHDVDPLVARPTTAVPRLPSGIALDDKALEKLGAFALEQLSPHTMEQVLPRILTQLNAAALMQKSPRRIQALRRRLSELILGKREYKNVAGKPGGGQPRD